MEIGQEIEPQPPPLHPLVVLGFFKVAVLFDFSVYTDLWASRGPKFRASQHSVPSPVRAMASATSPDWPVRSFLNMCSLRR